MTISDNAQDKVKQSKAVPEYPTLADQEILERIEPTAEEGQTRTRILLVIAGLLRRPCQRHVATPA